MSNLSWVREMGLSGFLDITLMSFLIYTLLLWSKRTRAAFVLTGILIVAGIYLLIRQFNLALTAIIFERFFAVILIALVVIFQEELRYFFEQIAVWSLNRRLVRRRMILLIREEVDLLVRSLTDLAKEKIGALIVLRGKDMIVRHLEGGVDLNGRMSEAILKSIFDPHSIGHDGAVIVEGDQITQISCHLPLSKNLKKIGKGGTRHAAALGLAELSDALCLVVSEERGTISVARHGDIEEVSDPEKLSLTLEKFYQEIRPRKSIKPWEGFFARNWREKIIAIGLALALWFVLVYGSRTTYKTFTVPVAHNVLPDPLVVTEIDPPKVYVTFGGPRNAFYFLPAHKIKLLLNLEPKKGDQRIRIYRTNLKFPEKLSMEVLAPQEIKVRIKERAEAGMDVDKSSGLIEKVRKALPLPVAKPREGVSQEEQPLVTETVAEPREIVAPEEKAEVVESLKDVRPEEVVKYLEQALEDKTKESK